MSPGPLLLVAALGLIAGMLCARWSARGWLYCTVLGALAGGGAALMVFGGAPDWDWRSDQTMGGEALHWRLDGLSALFLALVALIGGAGSVYASEYWPEEEYPSSAKQGRVWWCGLVLSMGWVLVSANGLHFLIGWELFTVCAFYLVTLDRQRKEVRAAGWLYLGASHAGTVCLFAFFSALAARTGSWELGSLKDHPELGSLFWLALIGFGVKAGMFPLHVWLPSAHANAPSHVSAILSGVAIKMGIYGLVRFSGWLTIPSSASWILLGLGSLSALFGIVFAFAQNDLKRLLAYCSVENVGIILVGLGLALLGAAHGHAAWGRMALAGGLLHIWNHGAFKALLFFGAGSVVHATGTREMSRLGGLWRAMPWTASLFALGSLAVAGLPPLNGFVSEWFIYMGLFSAAGQRGGPGPGVLPVAILLALSGALALASFMKAGSIVFLGGARTLEAEEAQECGPLMRRPMLVLAGICLAIGVAPMLAWPAIARASACWDPAWSESAAPLPLTALAGAQWCVALLGIGAAGFLWRKANRNGLKRGLTWDCGYAQPTARMQYTSGSFAGIAAAWFDWILRPERKVRRPHGPFPTEARHIEHTPETVLDRIMKPVSGGVLKISTLVRRFQHGRLQSYILYVLAGLVGIGVLVFWGGKP